MVGQTNINIQMDEDIKKEAELLFEKLGLNMSTAVNLFVHQCVRHGGIPFEITLQSDPFYNPTIMKRLQESINQMKQG
jgi:DNA-damage-inducible protein J